MTVPDVPRPLNIEERAVIEQILKMDFRGASELRGQLDQVQVVGPWSPESVSVDLQVVGDAPPAPISDVIVPVDAHVFHADGEPFGEILIWVGSGMLAAIEYAWYGDDPPAELPKAEELITSLAARRGH